MKTTIELYEKESGNKEPDNQIQYQEWYVGYVKWLEGKVLKSHFIDKVPENVVIKWLDNLSEEDRLRIYNKYYTDVQRGVISNMNDIYLLECFSNNFS